MNVTDRDRRMIFAGLEELLGEDVANNIMKLLPPQPHTELATRSDLAALAGVMRGEMAEFRGEIQGEMAEFRAQIHGEMAELRGEMAELRGEMRAGFAELRGEMVSESARVNNSIADLKRWGAAIVGANAIAMVTVLVA